VGSIFKEPIVGGSDEDNMVIGGITLNFRLPTGFVYREYVRRIAKLYNDNDLLSASNESFKQADGHYDVEKLHLLLDDNDEGLLIQMAACTKAQFNNLSWEEIIDEFRQNAYDDLLLPASKIVRRILQIDDFEKGDEDEKKLSTPKKSSGTD
jgi:hypothetical protein